MAHSPKQLARDLQAARDVAGARTRTDELSRLARAAGDGNPEAAATLIMHLGSNMLNAVRKVMGPQHPDVDDVTQDSVIALLGALETFRGECSVAHFAQRIALLTALTARRRLRLQRRWWDMESPPIEDVPDDGVFSPLAGTVARRRRELVRQVLDELPDVLAEALALHFALGYTVEEIAAATSVPANTIWSRLRLGKRALKNKLDRDAQLAEMFGLSADDREGKT
jgi:RNA polymerase sigma-70 factor (ECF subfamily)